jgi:TolB-like protein/Tfp pilus assembly protein PilF
MSFYEELKRRNVVKTAVFYVIASWLILQVADLLFEALDLPSSWVRLVLALLILGLPLALVFSWVYEMTPEGLKREKDIDHSQSITPETGRKINVLIIVLLVLAIGGQVVDQLMGQVSSFVLIGVIVLLVVAAVMLARLVHSPLHAVSAEATANTAAPEIKPVGGTRKAIAVLPFLNMSSDQEQEYFSDGLSEELLNLLAKIPELQVAARTSSFSFKGQNLEIQEIAKRLKVAHVLEGSVRKSGNRVRITAQLIQAEDGYHLWSETYDRTLDDIFAIQDEIAAEVVAQLKITLLGEAPKVQKTDPEAYALSLQARHFSRQSTVESYKHAIELFERALAIAPNYAAAWTGLGEVYETQARIGLRPVDEGYRLARESADKALAIAPECAPTHALLGHIASNHDNDLVAAARYAERALELEPVNPDILIGASRLFRFLGRLDQGTALLEYVVARDPVNPIGHFYLGVNYFYGGRPDEAIASFRTTLSLSPGYVNAQATIGEALLFKGKPDAALTAIQQEPEEVWRLIGLSMAYHALGQTAESDAALAELIEKHEQQSAYNIAYVLAFRGEADRAFEWLDKAVAFSDTGLAAIATQPEFANIKTDPRWLPFLESIGESPEQLDAIDFNVTLPE